MSIYRALARQMIGRQADLADLDTHLEAACAGEGHIVFLAGDAGVGKTRLLREFVSHIQQPNVEVLEGHCYDEDPSVPYGPFVDALRSLVRARGLDRLIEAAEPWLGDLVKLLPELESSVSPSAMGSDEQFQKRRLFDAIHHVLRPPADQRCRVVVLEDVHWSDQTSQELIRYLAQVIERDRLLIVLTYRTDELHRRHRLTHLIAQLTRERLFHETRLAPLSREEQARLLESTLEQQLPGAFVDVFYDRTEGNPFFIEELLKSLIERERLPRLIQTARQGTLNNGVELPISLKESILSRTAELDEATAEVLSYAAVIGRRFDFEVLLRLTGLSEYELVRVLESLVERQLVVEASDGDDRYSFRHALTREAIYEDLLGRERRIKHRAVLHVLEDLHGDRPESVIDQLAYHSLQARELPKTARYAGLAGEKAARMYAHREALNHYEVALDLADADDLRLRADLCERFGHAAHPLGEIALCVRYWRESRDLYEQLGDRLRLGDLERWLGWAAWDRGDRESAFTHTRNALAILELLPPGHELAMAQSALSRLYMLTGESQESIRWGESALQLAEKLGDVSVRAHAMNNIGVSLIDLGDTARGVESLEGSLELAKQHGLYADASRAYHNLGGYLPQLGEFQRAADLLYEGIDLATRIGYRATIDALRGKLAFVALELGRWDDALALVDQSSSIDQQSFESTCHAVQLRAEVLLRRGQLDESCRLLEGLLPDSEQRDENVIGVTYTLARAYWLRGDLDQAVAMIEQTLSTLPESQTLGKHEHVLSVAVAILGAAGRVEQARSLCESLEALATRRRTPLLLALLHESQGNVAAATDRPEDASRHFESAAAQWNAMGLPYQEARARRQRAEFLLRAGESSGRDEARRDLATARQIFESLGAAGELEAIESIARRTGLIRRLSRSANNPSELTPRERQVLSLVAQGYSNRAVAEALVISEKTAEIHVSNILGKLGVASRVQAARYAVEQGLVEPLAA